jgi:N-dimethylarginine dimethylaminohydrolase
MISRVAILMCPPDFYDVEYVINPWMERNIRRSSHKLAIEQWHGLAGILKERAELCFVEPQPGLPDMVFTANAGFAVGRNVALSHFFHRERRGEEPHFKKWFEQHGFTVHPPPRHLPFEGEGDALLDRKCKLVWAACGPRTALETHSWLAEKLGVEVVTLRLVDPRFYHLDTCFCPLEGGYVFYHPPAFDAPSIRSIEARVPESRRIVVDAVDAIQFACNAVNIGPDVVLHKASGDLCARLNAEGFEVIETPLSEFIKSGGAAKCLALRLEQPLSDVPPD